MKKSLQISNPSEYIESLEKLLTKGSDIDIDVIELQNKIQSIKKKLVDKIIRVVLLGSFSDGKTTLMAAMMEKLEDSMKIDSDESSDELKIYRPDGLKSGFEFVDTPGLFGTKEKEVDGKTLKFSDITKKYISEAHIVIYVCDAVVPLKESHGPIIKWIMRDLNKLDNSIFVINKMDETGYDITDQEEYDEIAKIKRENLINRLRDVIDLTYNEESKLHIACVAANPKGKGLQHWFSKIEDYRARSHIDVLNQEVNSVINSVDENTGELIVSTVISSVKDSLRILKDNIQSVNSTAEEIIKKNQSSYDDLKYELESLRKEIKEKKDVCFQNLKTYRSTILCEISSSSVETFSDVVRNSLGEENGKLTLYILNNEIDSIFSGLVTNIQKRSDKSASIFLKNFEKNESYVQKTITSAIKDTSTVRGINFLKKVTINKEQVKGARNLLFKSYKFKHSSVPKTFAKTSTKFLNTAGKFLGVAVAVVTVALEFKSLYENNKKEQEFLETKREILEFVNEIFANAFKLLNDETFFKDFCPQLEGMNAALEEKYETLREAREKKIQIDQYKHEIESFLEKC